jgi:anti-sigma factor (TIGR02949 family)
MNPTELTCEQALHRLFEFLDHELDAAEREAMQLHLSTCRSCFSRVDFERRLKQKLRELRREEPLQEAGERMKRLLESF